MRAKFPECELEEIDVLQDLVKPARSVVLRNIASTIASYGWPIATRRREARDAFFHTACFFKAVRELVARHLARRAGEFAFTLQTQSLYDASVESLPHFVFTDHTHLANTGYAAFDARLLFPPWWIELERSIYAHARVNFTMSNHVRRSLVEQYDCPENRAVCVGGGSNLHEPAERLVNDGYNNQRLLFVGVAWERKGGPCLLQAFAQVRQKFPGARLVIAGCAPPVEMENIEVLGPIPLTEVSAQMRRCSLLVFPTLIEPFGLVSIEAGLHKLPVVASNLGAQSDIVINGRTGLLVPPGDAPALAAALLELLADPEKCRRFGEAGFQFVKQNFTWNVVGTRMRDTITSALAPRQ